jgi:hypothetical protein
MFQFKLPSDVLNLIAMHRLTRNISPRWEEVLQLLTDFNCKRNARGNYWIPTQTFIIAIKVCGSYHLLDIMLTILKIEGRIPFLIF